MGCTASLAAFASVFGHLHLTLPSAEARWLPWAVLALGLVVTFVGASQLLTILGRALRHEDVAEVRGEELRAYEARTREVLTRIRDAIVVTGPDSEVLQWNEAAERVFDHSSGKAIGLHCHETLGLRGAQGPLDCSEHCALLNEDRDDATGVEVRRDRADGETQTLLASAGGVRGRDGELLEVVHTLRDISRLREADAAKSMFLATASHELRTPLTVIAGFAETLTNQEFDESIRQTAAETILRRVHDLTDIVDRLLLTSRIEQGRVQVAMEETDIVAIVDRVVQEFAATQDRQIEVTTEQSTMQAWVDPSMFETIVDHLVENALKYSPGGEPVEVALSHLDEGEVGLQVADHGVGMDHETIEHCFDRFWQGEQADDRRFGGTGIGLYVVKSLVESMGGRIEVQSKLGVGTTFTVRLRTDPDERDGRRRRNRVVKPARDDESLVEDLLRHTGVKAAA